MFDQIKEECGVFGIYSKDTMDVASQTYFALYALQHRGQESCGIVVNDKGILSRSEEHTLNSSHDRQSRMPSSA